jgi:hypothetical protein
MTIDIGLSPTKILLVSIIAIDSLILLQRQKMAQIATREKIERMMKAIRYQCLLSVLLPYALLATL